MRRYDIVAGILLILSIIDFALAAPVLVKETRRAHVNVAKIPESATTVMEKRLGEELEKLGEEYFKTSGKTIDSSGTHLSPNSAPSGPSGIDPWSTNDVQSPTQNPASSTSNMDQLPCCSPKRGLSARGGQISACRHNCIDLLEAMSAHDVPMRPGPVASYGEYHPLPMGPPEPLSMEMDVMKSKPSADADPNSDWGHWTNAEDPPSPSTAPELAPGPTQLKTSFGHTSGYGPGPSPTEDSVVHPPSPGAGEPPLDRQAALYQEKGKAIVESRSIPGATRDVGNAVQWELQPAERSLDPGE